MALPKDLKQRIDQAKVERSRRQTQINEYLDYADPSRPRIGDENKSQTDSAWKIQTLYDATLMEVHEDFGSDLVDRVMPRSRDWLAYEPETTLPEEIAKVNRGIACGELRLDTVDWRKQAMDELLAKRAQRAA